MHHPTDRITHTTAFITPVVEHWLEREITQWVGSLKALQKVCRLSLDMPRKFDVPTARDNQFFPLGK